MMRKFLLPIIIALSLLIGTKTNSGELSHALGIDDVNARVDEIVKQWKETQGALQQLTYDAVPGAQYMKWMRMAHEGTPEEQQQVKKLLQSYFNVDLDDSYVVDLSLEYSGNDGPLEYDFFTAGSPSINEIDGYVTHSLSYARRILGKNAEPAPSEQQKRQLLGQKIAAALNNKLDMSPLAPTRPNYSFRGVSLPPSGREIVTSSEMDNCFPQERPKHGISGESATVHDCLYKIGVPNKIEDVSNDLANAIFDSISAGFTMTQSSPPSKPWTIDKPFVFVLLRQDQLEKIIANTPKNQPAALTIGIKVHSVKDPAVTPGQLGPYEILLSEFDTSHPVAVPHIPGTVLVGAAHILGTSPSARRSK